MTQERMAGFFRSGTFDPSRRSALAKAMQLVAVAGTSWVVAGRASADSANKASQKAVGYQAQPNDGKKCANCAQFKSPDDCKLVQGPINPDGWCRLYSAKVA
jgi:High potential iron-sulfur protein